MLERTFDFVLSVVALFLLAPLFVVIGIFVKLDSPGPVFFRQERLGKDGDIFRIWKFRSMDVDAQNTGLGLNVIKNDSRITRVGRVLRKFSLDELPQLINVVKGEMSLVGPRPSLPAHIELYDERQLQRLSVKPGITGLAQIEGRAKLSWPERIELDLEYIENRGLLFDLWILFRTLGVLWSDTYNPEGHGWDEKAQEQLAEIARQPRLDE